MTNVIIFTVGLIFGFVTGAVITAVVIFEKERKQNGETDRQENRRSDKDEL